MAEDNQDIGDDETYYEGDALEVTFNIDEDGSTKDITGFTPKWYMKDKQGGQTIIDHNTTGVSLSVSDGSGGKVLLTIDGGVTDGESGKHFHLLRVEDTSGRPVTTTTGDMVISSR